MQILHYGNTFVKFIVKSPYLGDSTVLIDPFQTKTWGMRQPKMEADVVLFSQPDYNKKLVQKNNFVIFQPGEYETREISIYGMNAGDAGETIFIFKAEGITVGHIGSLKNTNLSNEAQELLNGVDILCVPVGGNDKLDSKQAASLVQIVEPRIVIPIYYKYKGAITKINDEKTFLKELGAAKTEELPKLNIKKKELPADEMKIILLHQ